MDWGIIISAICGSSVLTIVVSALVNRKNNKQAREFNYADKLEARVEKLERRVDRFEMRDSIYSSATACANGCRKITDAPDGCPVLHFLDQHPVPDKE